MIPDIRIEDFNYSLPDERIAKYPIERRDRSKLLVYKDGHCTDDIFCNLPGYLPEDSMMVFNDTKVVPARLFFRRDSGAHIEIFCLEPLEPSEYVRAFDAVGRCVWKCVIGNAKRWKDDSAIGFDTADPELLGISLKARLLDREGQTGRVEFSWDGGKTFSEVLDLCGKVPIPPYLGRDTEAIDLERYQTTYAHIRGSVAAPTA
ncbi:MAG: S-adenosylmethionine:tRNA ribosyltransferase-isomerase, partial [Bacteroidales bacterium]|nr:S-adenosylmethionine:tRNA ribosyltransferase-isomerase [Bacteroidales bacterium]